MRGSKLKNTLWFLWSMSWCASAYAAQPALSKSLSSLSLPDIFAAMGLALLGGLGFTLSKVSKPDAVVRSIPIEISKDLVTAMVAGLAAFFLVAGYGLEPLYQALVITIAGYGGSRTLEAFFDGGMARFRAFISPPPETPK